jgi:AcrR family transcriptional regulator
MAAVKPSARAYTMRARAASAARTADAILESAFARFRAESYDDVSLAAVADGAGVALKTVLRRFGSKDGLLIAVAQRYRARERAGRRVPAGDIPAAARVLAGRYEESMDILARFWPLEDRVASIGSVLTNARAFHRAWLSETFAPYLPRRRSALHEQRLCELVGATELYTWHLWRRRMAASAATAERALTETLRALVAHWAAERRTSDG